MSCSRTEQHVHQRLCAEQMEGGDGVDMVGVSLKYRGKCSQVPLRISQFTETEVQVKSFWALTDTLHVLNTVKKTKYCVFVVMLSGCWIQSWPAFCKITGDLQYVSLRQHNLSSLILLSNVHLPDRGRELSIPNSSYLRDSPLEWMHLQAYADVL